MVSLINMMNYAMIKSPTPPFPISPTLDLSKCSITQYPTRFDWILQVQLFDQLEDFTCINGGLSNIGLDRSHSQHALIILQYEMD